MASHPLPDSTSSAPSGPLLPATLAALVVAGVLLVTIVWPAEFGRDPTGVGHALGLYRPPVDAAADADAAGEAGAPSSAVLMRRQVPFRTDEMTLTLKPGEGAEIKASMGRGQRMVFSWTAIGGAGVDVDMHGEASNGDATSYWKDEWQTSGHGAFEAPFAGNHGWFWQNLNDDPVTVTVKVAGYHDRLLRP
ncbi:MAG: hypothetical protein OEW19_13335 [Acidobacteriota bacterium]|nr:hypothetical protein [Acidobacteriota bacterium]